MGFKKSFSFLLAGVSLLAACGNEGGAGDTEEDAALYDDRETILVGSIFANSGAYTAYGQPQTNAVQLAVEEINAAGGVLGKQQTMSLIQRIF